MTSELRPAVEVWDDAIAAWAADTIDTRQAAAAVIQAYGDQREAKFKALAETLAGALEKIAPITVRDGPDYAEVYFADGKTHSTQAMTMNPQDWLDLSEALREYKEARDAS